MRKFIVAAFVVVFVLAGCRTAPESDSFLPPCEFEDSVNCFWDASARGNGAGADFVNLDGNIYYI
ncbi:MAG: hypothetical protein LBI33_12845 [Propionibacteriaceae bacterium]|jgi:hypothetical protein|nr:hypothetical protein [Propionibacteriaceae bacterium]